MDNSRIIYLYQRFNDRTATSDEVLEFHAALADRDSAQAIKTLIEEKWKGFQSDLMIDLAEDRIDAVFDKITAQKQEQNSSIKLQNARIKLSSVIAIAASVLLVLGIGLFFYKQHSQISYHNISPGKNGATLTLSDGKSIVLSDSLNGNFAEESGVTITKNEHAELVYQLTDPAAAPKGVSNENTLSTAIGQTYQLRLPDGSKIWLNAASTLKYPASFASAKIRKVQLTGEAYFEVAHNPASPFVVESGKQRVEVLGTHFNINSYPDEKNIQTTLLEGAVRVDTMGNTGLLLKPNQQAVFSAGHLSVRQVDAKEFASWKEGKFSFDKEALSSIMRKVARWYNVTVVYQDNIADVKLTGSISRFERVDKFLEMLENTKEVHFKIEDQRIIVMK